MQIDPAVIAVTLGIESHQVSSSWKLDTSRSISNRYAPRGGLDEYHAAEADPAFAFFLEIGVESSKPSPLDPAVGGGAA
jgi:hypothetical protein